VNNKNYLQALHSQNQREQNIKKLKKTRRAQNAKTQANKLNPKFENWLNPNMIKKRGSNIYLS
jgi:hypothetical protein